MSNTTISTIILATHQNGGAWCYVYSCEKVKAKGSKSISNSYFGPQTL